MASMKYRGIYAGIFPGAVLILLAVHIATAVPIPQRLGPTEPIGEPNIVDPNLFPEQADNADLEFLEILESKDDLICNDKTSSRYEPLACWLWKLTVSLPNQSFKKLAFHVKIEDLSCSHFAVQSIDSTYVPSNRNLTTTTYANPSINLAVKGISASCTGKYKGNFATGGASGKLSLRARSDESKPAIRLIWDFLSSNHLPNSTSYNSTNYWMPVALTTNNCEAGLSVSDLHATGTFSGKLVSLFKGMIEDAVTSKLNEVLCPTIKESIDPMGTHAMLSADRTLTKYLPENNESSVAYSPMDYLVDAAQRRLPMIQESQSASVNFEKDTPVLLQFLHSINHFFDCFFDRSIHSLAVEKGKPNNPQNCTSRLTKTLKSLLSSALDVMVDGVHVPIPSGLHKIRFVIPKYGKVLMDVSDLRIAGLNQLDSLSLLSPIPTKDSPVSDFLSRLRAGAGVNITADVNITVSAIPGGMIHGDPLKESFHVHFNTSTLDALGTVGLALDRDHFQDIQFGTVLDSFPGIFHQHTDPSHNSTEERKCILESVLSLRVSDMQLRTTVDSVSLEPRFDTNASQTRRRLSPLTEKLEKNLDDLVNNALQLLLREYQPLLTDAASGFTKTGLSEKINHWIDKKLHNDTASVPTVDVTSVLAPDAAKRCNSRHESTGTQLLNFSGFTALHKLNDYINKPSTLASINKGIDHLAARAEKHHNTTSVESTLLSAAIGLDMSAMPGVSIHLRDLQIDNLGTVDHIDVLSPQLDGLHLQNGFSLGVESPTVGDEENIPTIRASFDVLYHPRNLSATINASMALGDIVLDGGSFLQFNMTRFRTLALHELLSHGHCVVVPFRGLRIYNNHTTSRIGTILANVSASVVGGARFDNFTVAMDTIEYPSASLLVNSVVGWITNTLQELLNSGTHSPIAQAERYCTGGQKFGYDDDPPELNDDYQDAWLLPVLGIFFAVLAMAQVAFFCCRGALTRRRGAGAITGPTVNEAEPLLPFDSEEHESVLHCEEKDSDANPSETLVHSTALSAFSRHAVPIFIIGTIVLLLSSNISSGATVDLYIAYDERTVSLPALFTFSLVNTAKDMWQAGVYPLFFLVLIMSGIWPYTKLLLMLGSWITPIKFLGPRKRERLLLALDSLGKFALVDTYLFVLMMVAFRYHLDVSGAVSLDAYVSPETGFYTFLAATCFSLLIGHFLVYCHRLSEMRHLSLRHAANAVRRESVLNHKYIVGRNSEGEVRLQLSRRFRAVLILAAGLAALLLSIGITRRSFKFEIGGIAGDVLGEQRTSHYSLLSLGSSLRNSVKDPSIGILVLEITYYFYAVVTPFACLAVLLLLLLCPMTLATQRVFLVLAEIANAWSAVEVFVISIIASLLEISTFASFIIGHRCDLIKTILKEYFESVIADDSDATCFTVRSSVLPSSCFLVLGVLVNSLIVSVLLRFVHSSVSERIQSEMKSSLVAEPVNDALRAEDSGHTRTIAGFLSWSFLRDYVFDGVGRSTSGDTPAYAYLPQSTDTYSVSPDVNWEDESTLHDSTIRSGPSTPHVVATSPTNNPFD